LAKHIINVLILKNYFSSAVLQSAYIMLTKIIPEHSIFFKIIEIIALQQNKYQSIVNATCNRVQDLLLTSLDHWYKRAGNENSK